MPLSALSVALLERIQFRRKLNALQSFAWSHFRTENRFPLFLKMLLTERETGERSLCLYVRRLDDRPPLLDLGFLQRAEAFRRLLLASRNLLPEVGELPADRRIGQRAHGGGSELGDHVPGRPLGHEHPAPDRDVQPRKPGLV